MSRLALLVVGMLVGAALVLVPIERGWLHSDEVRALFHPGAAPTSMPTTSKARRLTGYSCSKAGMPALTASASASASQLVSRMQPCDCVLPMCEGSGVPWMP